MACYLALFLLRGFKKSVSVRLSVSVVFPRFPEPQFFCTLLKFTFAIRVGSKTFAEVVLCVFSNRPLPFRFVNSKRRSKVLWRIQPQPRIPAQVLGGKWQGHFMKKRDKKLYIAFKSHWQDMFQQ